MGVRVCGNMPLLNPTSLTTTLVRSSCSRYLHGSKATSPSSNVIRRYSTSFLGSRRPSLVKLTALASTSFQSSLLTISSYRTSALTTMTSSTPSLTRPLPLLPVPSSSSSSSSTTNTTNESSSAPSTTPRLIYGTAWKKDQTADLVHLALRSGFRGIDTANQPRHYQEHLVGEGIRRAIADGTISSYRDIFIQTKYTAPGGQDPLPNCPYDPADPIEKQVRASVESSFVNLFGGGQEEEGEAAAAAAAVDGKKGKGDGPWIDSLVLHSPLETYSQTFEAWRVLETYVPHGIGRLGIANAPFEVVERLWHETTSPDSSKAGIKIPPSIVQNRFFAGTEYDAELRQFCREKGIVYQSFWTLTANNKPDNPRQGRRNLVDTKPVRELAGRAGVGVEVAYYCLVLGLEGITILDGTTKEGHMREDLDGVGIVGRFAESEDGKQVWGTCLEGFKDLIGEQDDF